MKPLLSLFLICLIITPLLPLASAHGVCTGIPPRFGRLDNVHFSNQSIPTGDVITMTGNITSMVQQSLQGYLSIHSNPSPHGRWTVVSAEPNERIVNITQFSRIPFSITVKALQPGTYKISPMIYLPEIGPAFSMLNGCNTEPVVTVTGNSICNQGFVGILKAEDGSPVCVKPDTAQKLMERGWAEEITKTNSTNLASVQNLNSTFRMIGGSGSGSFRPSIRSPEYFNETEFYTMNVGKIIPGYPVLVKISDPHKMNSRTEIIPSDNILPNGTFHYRINVTGRFGMDEYKIIFSYGDQSLNFTLPVMPPY